MIALAEGNGPLKTADFMKMQSTFALEMQCGWCSIKKTGSEHILRFEV